MNQKRRVVRILPLSLGDKDLEHARARMAAAVELLAGQADFAETVALRKQDAYYLLPAAAEDFDAIALSTPLAVPAFSTHIAALGKPVLLLEPTCGFHPYQATARAGLEHAGAAVLPTDSPAAIRSSVRALQAANGIRGSRVLLFVADVNKDAALALRAEEKLGVAVSILPVDELKDEARRVPETAASAVLTDWKSRIFSSITGVSDAHLIEVARLYLAERKFIERSGAAALGVEEFDPFLHQGLPMPNVTYTVLKAEGIVCTEEADLGCLLTQVLLCRSTGEQNTMSNIYTEYRAEFERLASPNDYTAEMEFTDYEECLADNCLVVSHFSTAGSLPQNMMVEDKPEIRSTGSSWRGQSMAYATPRIGPVTLARLDDAIEQLQAFPGSVADVRKFDHLGWYRCRWLVRVQSVRVFVERAIHHHFAITPGHPDATLHTLAEKLLRIRLSLH